MPTVSVPIEASVDDQYVQRGAVTYAGLSSATNTWQAANANTYADRELSGGTYYVINALFRFNTGNYLPDNAIITSAHLDLYVFSKVDADGLSVTIGYNNTWTGAAASDWTSTPETDAHAGTTIASVTTSAVNSFALSNLSNISTTGTTGFRMHATQRAADAAPTGSNYLQIATSDQVTGAVPTLVITYDYADNYIQVGTDLAGKKKRTQSFPNLGIDHTHTVHAGYDIQVDPTTGDRARVLNALPATTDYGRAVRPVLIEYGGTTQAIFYATGLAGLTAEALASITAVRNFVTGSTATTQTVPAGKTMRVYGITGDVRRTTGTGLLLFYLQVNLRVNTSGAATATSPIALSGESDWVEFAASTTTQVGSENLSVWIPGGIDIPDGASFGLGYITGTGTASRATVDIVMHAVEY